MPASRGRSGRELRAFAQALVGLLGGNLLLAAGTLTQRSKCVEFAEKESNRATASHPELTPEASVSAVSEKDDRCAAKEEAARRRTAQEWRSGQPSEKGAPRGDPPR